VKRSVQISVDSVLLEADLAIPEGAKAIVLFAHGSGSSRHSPRNQYVAEVLRTAGLGTLLMDLLTKEEDAVYETRFDIDLLTRRLASATMWCIGQPLTKSLGIGYFGASTGAAAALKAAAAIPSIGAVVSRGGRPDMAESALGRVQAPTLLIVGGDDDVVIELNQQAYDQLKCEKRLAIVPGATHLFEEPGTLEEVARLASEWFSRHLGSVHSTAGTAARKKA
jgi:putative phosphoribosyl transferase